MAVHRGEEVTPSKLSRLIHPPPPLPPSGQQQASLTVLLLLPSSSSSRLLHHLWVGSLWRLVTPLTSSRRKYLSLHPTSRRQGVLRMEGDCFSSCRELQVSPLPSLLFRSPSLVSPRPLPRNIYNPTPKKRQLGYLRT